MGLAFVGRTSRSAADLLVSRSGNFVSASATHRVALLPLSHIVHRHEQKGTDDVSVGIKKSYQGNQTFLAGNV